MADPLDDEAESEEEIAWRAFVSYARRRLDERRLVKTLVVWGEGLDDALMPTEGELPWLRLSPQPGNAGNRMGVGRDVDTPIRVMIDACCGTFDAARRMRYWAAIRRAIWPADPAARKQFVAAMAAVGVRQVAIVRPAYGEDVEVPDSGLIISTGEISLLLNVPGA